MEAKVLKIEYGGEITGYIEPVSEQGGKKSKTFFLKIDFYLVYRPFNNRLFGIYILFEFT